MVMKVHEHQDIYTHHLLDLRNVYVFKKIFSQEANYDILLDFLNLFLDHNIVEVIRVKNFNRFDHELFEEFSVDVKNSRGVLYNIEIHLTHFEKYREQMAMEWAKRYVLEVVQGDIGYIPQIVMYFVDFPMGKCSKNSMQKAVATNGNSYSDHFEMHLIHMHSKETLPPLDTPNRKWLDFIAGDLKQKKELAEKDPFLKRTLMSLIKLSKDELVVKESEEFLSILQSRAYYRYRDVDTTEWKMELEHIHYLTSQSCPMSYNQIAYLWKIPMSEVIAKLDMYYFF